MCVYLYVCFAEVSFREILRRGPRDFIYRFRYTYVCIHIHICVYMYICFAAVSFREKLQDSSGGGNEYGVATVSRIDKIIGLFCKRALYKRQYSAEETYNLVDPTDRNHPIDESDYI